jgi:hypothetical protein
MEMLKFSGTSRKIKYCKIKMDIKTTEITEMIESTNKKIPKKIFIVPYRNRVQQKFFFEKYMSFILENDDDYEIYFSHQHDIRSFNRGGTRNIGFLAIKTKYPNNYLNMTFIFNDVDTIPFNKIFDYDTKIGIVKHYYGFKYTLGGIVVIKGNDFEKVNGYPNYWAWGNEDNCFQNRCLNLNLVIDRSVFYPIGSPQILQLFDGVSRIISKRDFTKMRNDDGIDGIRTIHQLKYTIEKRSLNENDNIFIVENDRIFIINITHFLTAYKYENDSYFQYDLREPSKKIINPDDSKRLTNTYMTTDEWANIPYYPTIQERKMLQRQHPQPLEQKYNKKQPHPFSPEYAKYIGQKPKAVPSVNVAFFYGNNMNSYTKNKWG